MSTACFAAQNGGSRVYKIGRVGFDAGTEDAGGAYSGKIQSDPLSPDGEGGWTHFRRVQIRVRHTGSFTCTVTLYVDGVQTQIWSSGAQVDQSVTFVQAAPVFYPTDSEAETILEVDCDACGTFIVVELEVDSDDITGVFLVESVRIGRHTIRPGKQLGASAT